MHKHTQPSSYWAEGGKKEREERVQPQRKEKNGLLDFNITTVGVETRNSERGTEDSLYRLFTKKTINVCWSISLQLNDPQCFPGDHCLPALGGSSARLFKGNVLHEGIGAIHASQQFFKVYFFNLRNCYIRIVTQMLSLFPYYRILATLHHSCPAWKPSSTVWVNRSQ